MNMEQIMSKFSNFNSVLGNSQDGADDEMEEHVIDEHEDDEEDREGTKKDQEGH